MLSFLLCVVMIMCMIPTTLFAANSMTVEMGNGSIITILANKDINNITLPTDRKYGGVDVDFVITSDKTPIKSIEIGDCTWPLSGNRVEYSHHFTSTNADDSNIKVKNLSTIFEKKYKTTYKMTFTLSKKASNIKGIKVFEAGHYYTAKVNGE